MIELYITFMQTSDGTTIHFRFPSLNENRCRHFALGTFELLSKQHLKGPELTLLSAWLHRAWTGDPNSLCFPGGGSKSAEKTHVMVDLAPEWLAEGSFRKHCCRMLLSKGNQWQSFIDPNRRESTGQSENWILQELKRTRTI